MRTTDFKELITYTQSKDTTEVGLDTETSGLNVFSDRLLLLQLAMRDKVFTINVGTDDERMVKYILNLIKDRNLLVIGHNLKFDMKFIYHNYGVIFTNVFDTMLAEILSYIGVGSIYVSLQTLAKKYLSIALDKDIRETFINKMDYEFTDEQIEYAEKDAKILLQLHSKMQELLHKRGQDIPWELEMQLEPVITLMEYTGISLDIHKWNDATNLAKLNVDNAKADMMMLLEKNFDKYAGKYNCAYDVLVNIHYPVKTAFLKAEKERLKSIITKDEIKSEVIPLINFGSYKQAGYVLNRLGVPVKTTNAKEMIAYKDSHDIIKYLLDFRESVKRVTSFGDEFLKHVRPETGAIHTQFNQLGTATGRFSSENPNLQNIVADESYRSPFVARPGYLLATADYSNIELRIMGEASREPKFVDAFKNGQDLHKVTATIIYQVSYDEVTKTQRAVGKHLNFAVLYGTSAQGMVFNFRMPLEEAKIYLTRFFEQYNVLKSFINRFGAICLKKGYSITLGKRKRFLSFMIDPKSQDQYKELNRARRQAVNHLPQGTSADMIKKALVYLYYENPFGYENLRPLITVHDEIVVEFKEEIKDKALEFINYCLKKSGEDYLKIVPEAHEVTIDTHWSK
jgi:DNA polymerase I-like protein with 3'-5' exonuclease and polymerase domains